MADRTVTVKISAQDSFSEVLNKYNAELGTAQQSTEKVSAASNQMGQAIGGAIAAVGIQQVISFAENMNQLGTEVNVSRAQFAQLTQDMGGSAKVLDQLRLSTNGVTDDMTLMNASSQLLTTGLVSNSDELSKMLGMLQDLKPPTQSLDEAIGTLSQTLQTGSTRGLNQFGVNVEQVKNRIQELTDAGVNAQEAIKQATFEGMAKSLDRLGSAAAADETPLLKLQTQLSNIAQTLSGNFSTGLNATIGLMQAVGDYESRQGQPTAADTQAYARGVVIAQQFQAGFKSELDPQQLQDFISNYLKGISPGNALGNLDPGSLAKYAGLPGSLDQNSDTYTALKQIALFASQQNQDLDRAAQLNARNLELEKQRLDIARAEDDFRHREIAYLNQSIAAQQIQNVTDPLTELYQQLSTLQHVGTGRNQGGLQLFSQEDADRAQALQDQFGAMYDRAQALHDQKLISDDSFNAIKDSAAQVKSMADDIQRGADAFAKMKLSDITGVGGGGIQGEIADQVMAAAQKSGMSDANLQALQNTLDLSNGRQTAASQSEQKFAAGLVGLPPDVVAKAISNWVASQQAAALAGLSGAQLAGSEQYFAGLVGGGASQKITIKPGQGLNEVMRQYGLTQQQLQASGAMMGNGRGVLQGNFTVPGMGALDPNFNPQNAVDQFKAMQNQQGGGFGQGGMDFSQQMKDASQSLQDMYTNGQQLGDRFKEMAQIISDTFSQNYVLKITADAPAWLQQLLGGSNSAFQLIQQTVTNNGGRTPGATSAKPRGGPIVNPN